MMSRWIELGSYREFHSIIGDFPAGITDDAGFRTLVIQHGIGIVDVDEHASCFRRAERLAEQPAVAPQWQMPHLPRGFAPFLDGIQFVVFPEGPVKKC